MPHPSCGAESHQHFLLGSLAAMQLQLPPSKSTMTMTRSMTMTTQLISCSTSHPILVPKAAANNFDASDVVGIMSNWHSVNINNQPALVLWPCHDGKIPVG